MFDSLEFRIEIPHMPLAYELRKYDFKKKYVDYFYRNLYAKNGCKFEMSVYYAYRTPFFKIGFRAPQLFYGSSVEMVKSDDLEIIPDVIASIVEDNTPFVFDIDRAETTRLDVAYNHDVKTENNVSSYINHLKISDYPYKLRDIKAKYGCESVYFQTKKEKIVFYPKHAQTARLASKGKATTEHLKNSVGKLRHEHRYFDEKVLEIAQSFGYDDAKLRTVLRPHIAEEVIIEDMKKLYLDKEIIGHEAIDDQLYEKFGYGQKYESLLGFITACHKYGIERVREKGMCGNSRTVDARLKTLREAGISLSKLNAGNLPPLSAPKFDIDTEKYISQSRCRVIGNKSMSPRDTAHNTPSVLMH